MTVTNMILNRIESYRKKKVEFWSNFGEYPIEKAVINTKRINNKRDKQSPLLAFSGQVDHITPNELKAKYDRNNKNYSYKWIEHINNQASAAIQLIKQVSKELDNEIELARLNLYREHTYPQDIVYDLEYWKKFINRKDK